MNKDLYNIILIGEDDATWQGYLTEDEAALFSKVFGEMEYPKYSPQPMIINITKRKKKMADAEAVRKEEELKKWQENMGCNIIFKTAIQMAFEKANAKKS